LTLLDFLAAVRAGREGVVRISTLGVVMQVERALFEVSRVDIGLILGVFLGGSDVMVFSLAPIVVGNHGYKLLLGVLQSVFPVHNRVCNSDLFKRLHLLKIHETVRVAVYGVKREDVVGSV
jgi:hypothetical protein